MPSSRHSGPNLGEADRGNRIARPSWTSCATLALPASRQGGPSVRTWLALVLTCQVFVGAFLGITAQFVLAIGVIFYVLPWMGLELLETARVVAEFDLPGRVLGLLWGNQ